MLKRKTILSLCALILAFAGAEILAHHEFPPGPGPESMNHFSQTLGSGSTDWGWLERTGVGPVYVRSTVGDPKVTDDASPVVAGRIWMEFDISSLSETDIVSRDSLKLTIKTGPDTSSEDMEIASINNAQPTAASDADLWFDFLFGANRFNEDAFLLDTVSETQEIALDRVSIPGNFVAGIALQSAITAGQSWFAVGLKVTSEGTHAAIVASLLRSEGITLEFDYMNAGSRMTLCGFGQ